MTDNIVENTVDSNSQDNNTTEQVNTFNPDQWKSDPSFQAWFNNEVSQVVEKETVGLKNNNGKILSEKKQLQEKLENIKSTSDIESIYQAQLAEKDDKYGLLESEYNALKKSVEDKDIDAAIYEAMKVNNIIPGLQDAFKLVVKQDCGNGIKVAGGSPAAVGGKLLSQHVADMITSNEAYNYFVQASNNSGGGSENSKSNGGAGAFSHTQITPEDMKDPAFWSSDKAKLLIKG